MDADNFRHPILLARGEEDCEGRDGQTAKPFSNLRPLPESVDPEILVDGIAGAPYGVPVWRFDPKPGQLIQSGLVPNDRVPRHPCSSESR